MPHREVPFEQIPHTADLQIKVFGTTLPELFANAALSMFAVLEPQFVEHAPQAKHTVKVSGINTENLLVNFLSECLYLSAVNHEAYTQVTLENFTETTIAATLHGQQITRFSSVEIKAVTYHDLSITKTATGWQATITFDI